MALTLITGRTGSGKTFFSITKILEYLNNDNRLVYTNISLNVDFKNYKYMQELDVKKFFNFIYTTFANVDNLDLKKEQVNNSPFANSVFFIDEAHLVGFGKKTEAVNNWLTLHRHFGQDIFVITQIPNNISRDYLPHFHTWFELIPPNKRVFKNKIGYREFDSYKGDRLSTRYIEPVNQIFELYNTGKTEVKSNPKLKKFLLLLFVFISIVIFIIYYFINVVFVDGIKVTGVKKDTNKSIAAITKDKNSSKNKQKKQLFIVHKKHKNLIIKKCVKRDMQDLKFFVNRPKNFIYCESKKPFGYMCLIEKCVKWSYK